MVIGCLSYVSTSWQPPVRHSVFRQQYQPPKPLGGITPIFTGLTDPLSELFKIFHFIKKSGCHGNQNETLLNLVKNFSSDFKIIWYNWSLGHPLPKCSNYFDWFKNMTTSQRGPFFCDNIGETFFLSEIYLRKTTLFVSNHLI